MNKVMSDWWIVGNTLIVQTENKAKGGNTMVQKQQGQHPTKLPLRRAKFCVNCEVFFEGNECPECGRTMSWVWATQWVKSMNGDPEFTKRVVKK